MNNDKQYQAFLKRWKDEFLEKWNLKKHSQNLTIKDFDVIATLGHGSFGVVLLMKKKDDKKICAVKLLNKEKIVKLKQVSRSIYEKRVLASINHIFCIKLEFCFKDNANLYLAITYAPGGDMFHFLRKKGKLSEKEAAFYASQVILAFEYLHQVDLLHRDLKPENVLLNRNGYIKLTDFGLAKKVDKRTWSLCGTPEYLAPEIILNKGYGKSADYWTIGVLIYEMVAGYTPFQSPTIMQMYEKIAAAQVKYPPTFSNALKSIVGYLLQKDVTKRYGCLVDGINDIKKHKWFENINWMDVLKGKYKPSFVPKLSGPLDTSNFRKEPSPKVPTEQINKYEKEFAEF